ncbi:DUF2326 domain-containing protein [Streptomyces sp. CA-106131]|uniref:DUF2326 domain-containing protein n=1 Tax=Streptomyces sp. CA-106131 TaxID=3240045 RepID=UPI003D8FDFB9
MHDSHLFDGVDARQLAAALYLAADVTQDEGLQYIATFNSDDLDKATRLGFEPGPYIRQPHPRDERSTPAGSATSVSDQTCQAGLRP